MASALAGQWIYTQMRKSTNLPYGFSYKNISSLVLIYTVFYSFKQRRFLIQFALNFKFDFFSCIIIIIININSLNSYGVFVNIL